MDPKTQAFDWQTLDIEAPFTKWFTADGEFVAKPFQQWLASNIPVVGDAAGMGGKSVEDVSEAAVVTGSNKNVDAPTTSKSRKARQ